MTDIIKIIGAAFLTAITTIVLKTTKPELSFAVLIAGTVIILLFLVDLLQVAFTAFSSIVAITGMENGLIRILLKIVGIGYLTEFSAGILNDFGAASVADKVVLAGKLVILVASLPIIESLLTLFRQFLSLL